MWSRAGSWRLVLAAEGRRASVVTAVGFRLFFLLAPAWGAAALALWTARLLGRFARLTHLDPLWHAHEMTLGFAGAVVVGFLFTAVRNWTSRPTPHGAALAALAATWLAARLGSLVGAAAWGADVVFLAAAGAAVARPIFGVRQWRNVRFPLYLWGLAAADAAWHLADPVRGMWMVLACILGLVAGIGGRVVPFFIRSRLPHAAPRTFPIVEAATEAAVVLAVGIGAPAGGLPGAALAAVAGLLALARAWGWSVGEAWREPMLSVLLAAYVALGAGLLALAGASAGLLPWSAPLHVLTAGAISGMIFGMMPRVTRGHTGRPIRADAGTKAIFALVYVAAIVRLAAVWAPPPEAAGWLAAASASWIAGALLFLGLYGPMLLRPRIDGRPG